MAGEPPAGPEGSPEPAERGGPFDGRGGGGGEGEGGWSSIGAGGKVREEAERKKIAAEQRPPRPEQLSRNVERASNGGTGAGRGGGGGGAVSMARSITERLPRPRQILEGESRNDTGML